MTPWINWCALKNPLGVGAWVEPPVVEQPMVELVMRIFSRARNHETDPLRLFYFHLEALQTSVIHPKYVDDQLLSQLALSESDLDYAGAVREFVDRCAGTKGAPTTVSQRAVIVAAIEGLRKSVPSSELNYRFGLHELDWLETIVISMSN